MKSDPHIDAADALALAEQLCGRLQEALAILEAIDAGDLLSATPSGAENVRRHQCGISLLAVLRRELEDMATDLQSAGLVQNLMQRVASRGTI